MSLLGRTGLMSRRQRVTPEISLLGIGTAMSLAGVDVVYVRRRVISPIYLGDALVELVLAAFWLAGLTSQRSRGAD
jgi:hypothetical protein